MKHWMLWLLVVLSMIGAPAMLTNRDSKTARLEGQQVRLGDEGLVVRSGNLGRCSTIQQERQHLSVDIQSFDRSHTNQIWGSLLEQTPIVPLWMHGQVHI